ncbi:hypothetical protein DWB84_07515 [Saccharophagus sp. K07]|nr:hypothetical protein [Saccharophagus sp. K07]
MGQSIFTESTVIKLFHLKISETTPPQNPIQCNLSYECIISEQKTKKYNLPTKMIVFVKIRKLFLRTGNPQMCSTTTGDAAFFISPTAESPHNTNPFYSSWGYC